MNTSPKVILSSVAAISILIGTLAVTQRKVNPSIIIKPAVALVSPAAEPPPRVEIPVAEHPAPVQSAKAEVLPAAHPKKSGARSVQAAKVKEPIQDPDARVALSMVGLDPAAEQYWLAAINDTSLPANERKDLIEDLNEAGLSNPHQPGPQDLPAILNRLALIEELAPYAVDRVNWEAFQEAYKDLIGMLAGKPAH